jgi:hypothetical protein
MLLSVLLLVAAVHAAPVAASHPAFPGQVSVYGSKAEAMEAIRKAAACRERGVQLVDQPPPNLQSKVQRLGDLPPANHTLTVLRSIDGCPVSSTIRFNVDRPAGRR